jgi:WD40 repeat protein
VTDEQRDPPHAAPPLGLRSPYVGLVPFGEKDAPFFFGRSREQRVVMANLRAARLTVMFGASGVGKSSVLLAGVIPKLRQLASSGAAERRDRGGTLLAEKPPFAVSYFNAWHDEPLPRLADAVRRSAEDALGGESLGPWVAGTPLRDALHDWTAHVRTLLIVLDQFEEYFLYHPAEKGQGTLAHELPEIVNDPNLHVNVLLSIREDAVAVLDRFKGVIPHLYGNTLRIDYLDRAMAEEAIVGPVAEHNKRLPSGAAPVTVHRDLVGAVLDATRAGRLALGDATSSASGAAAARRETDGGAPEEARVETPFLQLVMDRLWRASADAGETEITVQTLDRLGSAERIVERHLADALDALEPGEQEIAAEAFAYLVTPSNTKVAHTASDLAYWTKRRPGEVTAVLHRLSGSECGHIVRPLRPAPGETEPRYEIFHDVLAAAVLGWRVRHDQEREKQELAASLVQEQEEARAAEHERQREARARLVRWATVGLGVLVVALGAAVLWAFHERSVADSQRFASEAQATLPVDPEQSVSLALKALDHSETNEAQDALRTALTTSRLRAVLGAEPPRRCGGACAVGAPLVKPARFVGNALVPGTVAWSPDGDWVASGEKGRVRAWWPRSGEVRVSPGRSSEPVHTIAISADSRWVASADGSGAVRLWAPTSGETRQLAKRDGQAVAFSADGAYVAAATEAGPRIWRVADGSRIDLPNAGAPSSSVALSRDGGRLASLTFEGRGRVWDLAHPASAPSVLRGSARPDDLEAWAANVDFGRDGQRVVAPTTDAVGVFDAASGRKLWEVASSSPEYTMSPGSTFFAPDGLSTLTLFGKNPGIWHRDHGWAHLRGHTDFVTAAAYSPDGRLLATASRDGTARIWDAATQLPLITLAGHVGQVDGVAFSPDGKFVVTRSNDDGTTRVWSVDRGRVLRGSTDWVLDATWSPDGKRVATASKDGHVRVHTPATGKKQVLTAGSFVNSVDFSPDGRRLVASTTGDGAWVWNLDSGAQPAPEPIGSVDTGTYDAKFSPDGRTILTVDEAWAGPVSLFDARTLERKRFKLKEHDAIGATFSPNGKLLAVLSPRGLQTVDARTGRTIRTFKGHRGAIQAVAFSSDGRRMVSGGNDRTLRVWDVRSGRSLTVMRGHEGWIASVDFGPGDRTVASASEDGTTRVWDASTERQLTILRNQADAVNSVEFNPRDGSILSGSDDFTATIVRCETCADLDALREIAQKRVWELADGS